MNSAIAPLLWLATASRASIYATVWPEKLGEIWVRGSRGAGLSKAVLGGVAASLGARSKVPPLVAGAS